MATNLLVDRVSTEARQFHLGRVLLTALVGLFWLLGWLVGKLSLGIGYGWAAVKVGWDEARQPKAGPRGRAT